MLIAARALLGVGGAIMMPSTLSLARNMFLGREQRRYAMVVWAAMASVGGAAGPIVDGWIIETFSRQAAFLMNIPVMLLLLVLGPLLLPGGRNPDLHRIDIPSVALSFVGQTGVVYSIKTLTGGKGAGLGLMAPRCWAGCSSPGTPGHPPPGPTLSISRRTCSTGHRRRRPKL